VRRREELKAAKEEAEEAARVKSALLTNMNHELRTPLTSIISFGEILASSPELADTFAERIVGGGKRLLRTLNTVMDFAELEAGTLNPAPVSLDVRDVARSVAGDFQSEAGRKDLALEVDTPDAPVRAHLDKHLVERVLAHLVSNAVKFTEEGGAAVTVRQEGGAAEIEVRDTGIGIPPEARPRVFEEFYQASTGNDRTHEGNGLGLTIARRIVERMEGTIELESEQGTGTRVTVRFPRNGSP
jgi:signal transduction histidine kinase